MEKRSSAADLQGRTNWDRVDRMKDEDIDLSDLPEISPEMFAQAVVRKRAYKDAHEKA